MRLTLFSDYCLRVLIYVGSRDDKLSTIDEISSAYGISRNHLMKVVYRLGQLGYLQTVRGKGGGMRLAKPPEKINVGRLIRETEDDFDIVECFKPGPSLCAIEPACVLRTALSRALREFLNVMQEYTLADLLAPNRRLSRLLDIA